MLFILVIYFPFCYSIAGSRLERIRPRLWIQPLVVKEGIGEHEIQVFGSQNLQFT